LGMGVMPVSQDRIPAVPHGQAIATVHAALDAGITFFDTADTFAPSWDTMGHNEKIVAEALRTWSGDASQVVVATKRGITRRAGAATARPTTCAQRSRSPWSTWRPTPSTCTTGTAPTAASATPRACRPWRRCARRG